MEMTEKQKKVILADDDEVEINFKVNDTSICLKKILLCIMVDIETIKDNIKKLKDDLNALNYEQ